MRRDDGGEGHLRHHSRRRWTRGRRRERHTVVNGRVRREAGTEGGNDGEEGGISGVQDTGRAGGEKADKQTDNAQSDRATPRAATNSTRNGATVRDYRSENPATETSIHRGRAGPGPRDAATANANLHLSKDRQGKARVSSATTAARSEQQTRVTKSLRRPHGVKIVGLMVLAKPRGLVTHRSTAWQP